MHLLSYLFSYLDVDAVNSWIRVIEKEDPDVNVVSSSIRAIEKEDPEVASRTSNNLYAILRVTDYSIDIHEIKKAYMFKALLFHPDKCSSIAAEGATKLINTGWQVLSDPKRKNMARSSEFEEASNQCSFFHF
ncbi:hypothetical protein QYF36_025986 [Acer negundo]|nr:hypothetical protein QYF36_025986 [Acer negundo]